MKFTADQIRENRETWLKALESGEWKQCFGSAKLGDAFCAMGLARRLLTGNARSGDMDALCGMLGDDARERIVKLNDKEARSFPAIAAELRAHPDKYFAPLDSVDRAEGEASRG